MEGGDSRQQQGPGRLHTRSRAGSRQALSQSSNPAAPAGRTSPARTASPGSRHASIPLPHRSARPPPCTSGASQRPPATLPIRLPDSHRIGGDSPPPLVRLGSSRENSRTSFVSRIAPLSTSPMPGPTNRRRDATPPPPPSQNTLPPLPAPPRQPRAPAHLPTELEFCISFSLRLFQDVLEQFIESFVPRSLIALPKLRPGGGSPVGRLARADGTFDLDENRLRKLLEALVLLGRTPHHSLPPPPAGESHRRWLWCSKRHHK